MFKPKENPTPSGNSNDQKQEAARNILETQQEIAAYISPEERAELAEKRHQIFSEGHLRRFYEILEKNFKSILLLFGVLSYQGFLKRLGIKPTPQTEKPKKQVSPAAVEDINEDDDENAPEKQEVSRHGKDIIEQIIEIDDEGNTIIRYFLNGKPFFEEVDTSGSKKLYMLDRKGKRFSTFKQMQTKHPNMTPEKYLDFLATELDHPAKLDYFFNNILKYRYDKKGIEHWQTAKQTVETADLDNMYGDCDDYAFLAREILTRQGKTAHVIGQIGHAFCITVEKNNQGKYDVHSLGTFGYDANGNRYKKSYQYDPQKAKGYKTIREGIIAITKKYEQDPQKKSIFGEYAQRQFIPVLDIPAEGRLGGVLVPVEMLDNPKIIQTANGVIGAAIRQLPALEGRIVGLFDQWLS